MYEYLSSQAQALSISQNVIPGPCHELGMVAWSTFRRTELGKMPMWVLETGSKPFGHRMWAPGTPSVIYKRHNYTVTWACKSLAPLGKT